MSTPPVPPFAVFGKTATHYISRYFGTNTQVNFTGNSKWIEEFSKELLEKGIEYIVDVQGEQGIVTGEQVNGKLTYITGVMQQYIAPWLTAPHALDVPYFKGSRTFDKTTQKVYISLQDENLNHALTETAWWSDSWRVVWSEHTIGSYHYLTDNADHNGMLLCDGRTDLLIADHPLLFAKVGTAFGGNGTTTFGIPDLRSRTVAGAGQGVGLQNRTLGTTVGEESTTLTQTNLPFVQITIPTYARDGSATYGRVADSGGGRTSTGLTEPLGDDTPFNNMQPTAFSGYYFIFSGTLF